MSTFVIGDVQGCFASFQDLLARITFSPQRDFLWLLGDLVNRGPRSLAVLRWVFEHQDRVRLVLGNHDLHLIARYRGVAQPKALDTLEKVLEHAEASQWISWLQHQPIAYREGEHAMVHGGILPGWDWSQVEAWARDTERRLQGPEIDELLTELSGKKDLIWPHKTGGISSHAAFLKIVTRLRVCNADGRVHFGFSGAPEDCPDPFRPWFDWPHQLPAGFRLYFGHWSALGLMQRPGFVALDTGCVWGKSLSALRLEDGRIFQVSARES